MIGDARYLIRFDDICPGMNWRLWREIEKLLNAADLKPVLAVVPSNLDEKLNVDAPEPQFWDRVREWQRRGWTIGLHGYEHRYVTREAGIVGLNQRSEFAGLPADEQLRKLEKGVEIFRQQQVRPEVWIAPAHSFDTATIGALKRVGIDAISDGFFLSPHRDQHDMLWVPQQIWSFRPRRFGTWTVCYHHNDWSERNLRRFADDLKTYRSRITSFAEVASAPNIRTKAWYDTCASTAMFSIWRSKTWLRNRLTRGPAGTPQRTAP